jgi:3-deoxy-7-phosphoheptulonate synthase
MPVGFKNGTDGGLEVALNAMISARSPHAFLGINADGLTAVIKTTGNPDRHVVLRGGNGRPNYSRDDIARAAALVEEQGIVRPIMVDCSHDNSRKDHRRQGAVCRAVLEQVAEGNERIMGLLLESNLKPGKQTWKEGSTLEYGVSITDACIGWDETETLLYEMAEVVGRHGSRQRAVGSRQ